MPMLTLGRFVGSTALLIMFAACSYEPDSSEMQNVTGYIPVYGEVNASEILMAPARNVEDPGKIYVYGKYLLVNEKKAGIHVFDNSDPAQPMNLGFVSILGNTDMAIKDDILYADHLGNLVALSIGDFSSLEEKGRLPLRNWHLGVPPPAGFYFQCIDPDKGLVVFWKRTQLQNPQCYALR